MKLANAAATLGLQAPYHFTDGLGLLRKLMGVHLLCLQHSSVHFFPLHLLFPSAKWWLPSNHFINETAQPPVVRAECISLVVQHFWSCGGERCILWQCLMLAERENGGQNTKTPPDFWWLNYRKCSMLHAMLFSLHAMFMLSSEFSTKPDQLKKQNQTKPSWS